MVDEDHSTPYTSYMSTEDTEWIPPTIYSQIPIHVQSTHFSQDTLWWTNIASIIKNRHYEPKACLLGEGVLAHELNGIVNRVNLLRHIVSNLQGKLVFNRHNHLHHVQRVQLQVVDEVGVLRHLRQLDRGKHSRLPCSGQRHRSSSPHPAYASSPPLRAGTSIPSHSIRFRTWEAKALATTAVLRVGAVLARTLNILMQWLYPKEFYLPWLGFPFKEGASSAQNAE